MTRGTSLRGSASADLKKQESYDIFLGLLGVYFFIKSLLRFPFSLFSLDLPLDPMVPLAIIDLGELPLVSRLADRTGKQGPATAANRKLVAVRWLGDMSIMSEDLAL